MNTANRRMQALIGGLVLWALLQPVVTVAQPVVVQEVLPQSRNQPPEVRSPDAWGSAIRLAPKILSWLIDSALQSRVDAEISKLRPEALKRMPKDGGVLIVVGISESKVPDVNGNRQRYFLDAYIAEVGATPKATLEKFLKSDRLDTGPPSGFIRRDTLLWLTR